MPGHVVHIAGLPVKVGRIVRQRCAWCGAVIDDVDLSAVAVVLTGAGDPQLWPTWPVGALLGVDGGVRWVIEHADGDDVPPECCASLDPTVTA